MDHWIVLHQSIDFMLIGLYTGRLAKCLLIPLKLVDIPSCSLEWALCIWINQNKRINTRTF